MPSQNDTALLKRTFAVIMVATLPHVAPAQIGMDVAACNSMWQQPTGGPLDTNGCGTLLYSRDSLQVSIAFIAGKAQRISYAPVPSGEITPTRILDWNAGTSEWSEWSPPGRRPAPDAPLKWVRFDERAMAQFKDGTFTIHGSGWRQKKRRSPTSPAQRKPPSVAPVKARGSGQPTGTWETQEPGIPSIAVKLNPDGSALCQLSGPAIRQRWRATWRQQRNAPSKAFVLVAQATPDHAESGVPLAVIEQDPSGNLMLLPRGGLCKGRQASGLSKDLRLQLLATRDMPEGEEATPDGRPARGTPKEEAIRMLGKPNGSINWGGREALVYPWGYLWIVDGVVWQPE